MIQPRLIPVLLLRNNGLVKSIQFKDHHYIGDPINAVRIFNEFMADEFFLLDIDATKEKRTLKPEIVRRIGEEANMPLAAGGGIKTLEDIRLIIEAGAERVVINSAAGRDTNFIKMACDRFGASSIVVCIDVKRNQHSMERVFIENGEIELPYTVTDYAKMMEDNGVGEIVVQSIDNDGSMCGYDLPLLKKVSEAVTIPIVALGGAGSLEDMKDAVEKIPLNGLAAGSFFVYLNRRGNVLINYPEKSRRQFNHS